MQIPLNKGLVLDNNCILQHFHLQDEHTFYQEDYYATNHQTLQHTSPSEAVPIILPFPGTEPNKRSGLLTVVFLYSSFILYIF